MLQQQKKLTLSKQKETATKRNHVVSLTTQIQTVLESMYIESMSQDSLKTPTLVYRCTQ